MDELPEYHIHFAGWYHVFVFCVLLPWSAFRSARKLKSGMAHPERRKHFVSVTIILLLLLAFSLLVMRGEHMPWVLGERAVGWKDCVYGLAFLTAFTAFMLPRWKRSVQLRNPRLEFFSPRNGIERLLWVCVSAAAAVSEEISYRGVLFGLLWWASGSAWIAAIVSATVFGVAHIIQGWKSALVIGVFAIAMQGLVYVTGSLYVPIAVHFVYDVIAGFVYGHLIRQRDALQGTSSSCPTA